LKHNIDKNKHYFALMHPIEHATPFFNVVNHNKFNWVECCVDESRFKVEDGYKITLRALNPLYSFSHYYQSDFMSLIEDGYIIPKTSENAQVRHIKEMHKSGNCVYIIEYDTVVE